MSTTGVVPWSWQRWSSALAASLILWTTGIAIRVPDARAQDKPIKFDSLDQSQSLEQLTGEGTNPLQLSGFAAGSYRYDQNSRDNSFSADKIAISLFREINAHVWAFAQLTTALHPGRNGGEPTTETEIDNLLIQLVPPGAPNFNVAIGKFDAPIGFERDDEPLNFQTSGSYNLQYARPVKLVGAIGRWNIQPRVDLAAYLANGWDAEFAPNHAKTAGTRLGITPLKRLNVGASGVLGSEGDPTTAHRRYLLNVDYTWQPTRRVILAGEGNLGREADPAGGASARWRGATVTLFARLGRNGGAAVRGDLLDDQDGTRTSTVQRLTSFTFTPLYFLGVGRQGIFANVEHTTFRIPRFQIRAEARWNHSNDFVFPKGAGFVRSQWQYTLQLVTVF